MKPVIDMERLDKMIRRSIHYGFDSVLLKPEEALALLEITEAAFRFHQGLPGAWSPSNVARLGVVIERYLEAEANADSS